MIHKKIYNDFARMIRSQRHGIKHIAESMPSVPREFLNGRRIQTMIIVDSLIELFVQDNPQFNADKFIKACEITES